MKPLTDNEVTELRHRLGVPDDYEERAVEDREGWAEGCAGTILIPPGNVEIRLTNWLNFAVEFQIAVENGHPSIVSILRCGDNLQYGRAYLPPFAGGVATPDTGEWRTAFTDCVEDLLS